VNKLISLTGAAGAVAAVAAGTALADHKPGHPPPGGGTADLTLTADTPIVRYNPALVPPGGVAALSGRLRNQAAAGQVVALTQNPAPLDDNLFEPTGRETTTDAQGRFRFTDVTVPVNTQFRAQTGIPPVLSTLALVRVRPRVGVAVSDRTPHRGERVRFRGRIWPEHDGKPVRIQRRSRDGSFRTVRETASRDVVGETFSRYRARVRVRSTGVFRVVVRTGDEDHVNGISRKRRLTVG
jgi:hypothetical protein